MGMGSEPSFFRRIARHGISGRDPREDRLIEICAAVFAAEPGQAVALHILRGWLRIVANGTGVQEPGAARQAIRALELVDR